MLLSKEFVNILKKIEFNQDAHYGKKKNSELFCTVKDYPFLTYGI